MLPRLPLVLFGLALGTTPSFAQSVLLHLDCPDCGPGDASRAAPVGDVDGDGVVDVALALALQVPNRALVLVRSGTDGSLLHELEFPLYSSNVQVVGAGDVNGDGHADIAVSTPLELVGGVQPGVVRVLSGLDGSQRWRVEGEAWDFLGIRLERAGDVNGDGIPDLAAVADRCFHPEQCLPNHLRVLSGVDGTLLLQLEGSGDGSDFGWDVDAMGDIDGDGHGDLLVSELDGGNGRVQVRSGLDGAVLLQLDDPYPSAWYGRQVTAVGDIDGDGAPDLAVRSSRSFDPPAPARVDVYSSGDGTLLWSVEGEGALADEFAFRLDAVPDMTGDGLPDLVAGNPFALDAAGAVELLSGSDGARQHVLLGEVAQTQFGHDVAGVPDLDGDGRGEFLVTSHWGDDGPGSAGSARLYSGACFVALERGCPARPSSTGLAARLDSTGSLSIVDDELTLQAAPLPAGSWAQAIGGETAAQLPFGDGYLCISPFAPGLTRLGPPQLAAVDGSSVHPLDLAALALPPGSSWSFQVLYRDAGSAGAGFNGSDSLRGTFCP